MWNYIKISLLIIFLGLLGLLVVFRKHFTTGIFEKNAPVVGEIVGFNGFGVGVKKIEFEVSDKGVGLDAVVVRLEQAGKKKELLNKTYADKVNKDSISINVNAKELGFKEGQISLSISAFDKSFFSNATKKTRNFDVDFKYPDVSYFSDQRNAVSGGSELVFFKVKEKNLDRAGIFYKNMEYQAVSADKLSPIFAKYPEWYVCFFPLLKGIDSSDKSLKIFAIDKVGNIDTADFNYHVQKMGYPKRQFNLNVTLFEKKVEALYSELLKKGILKSQEITVGEKFELIDRQLREEVEQKLKDLLIKRSEKKSWEGGFLRFQGKEVSTFGQEVILSLNSQNISSNVELGASFQAASGTSVYAANNGIVIFADYLANYGNTVIIDHGLGVNTIYSHLGAISKNKGQEIEKGSVIGTVGDSGLVFGPTLGFEIRVYGSPVRPIEWWDEGWMRDHIDKKIENLKADLGVAK